jgi:hypothetical protein
VGLNASLSVIARSEFRKYPRVNPTPLVDYELYKEWNSLELALRIMPTPLGLALRGNRPTVEEFDDDWDAYDAFVTPGLVRRVSEALAGVTEDELVSALKEQGFASHKAERTGYLAAFRTLKAAYREAAKQDAYLRIFIC